MEYSIGEHSKHLQLTIQGTFDQTKMSQMVSLALHRLRKKDQAHLLIDLRKVTGDMMTTNRMIVGYQCGEYFSSILPHHEETKVAIVESSEVEVEFKDDSITEDLKFYNTPVLITRDYEKALKWIESD